MHPKRNQTADLLKGTAILLMIQVHVMELFATSEVQASTAGKASLLLGGPPVAPVFMAVMGYYAFKSRRSIAGLMIRAVRLLAIGIALNIGLNLHLLVKISCGAIQLDPWPYVLGVDILFLAAFATVAIAWLRPVLRNRWWGWSLAAILVAASSPLVAESLTVSSLLKWPLAYLGGEYAWSYFSIFPWLAYPLLGAGFGVWHTLGAERRVSAVWTGLVWCVAVVGLVGSGRFAVETSCNLAEYYKHDLSFFAWTASFLGVWTFAASKLEFLARYSAGAWLAWVGRNVTACYVVQWLIIGNTATAIYQSESLLHCALWVVSIVVATSLIVLTIQSVKAAIFTRRNSRT